MVLVCCSGKKRGRNEWTESSNAKEITEDNTSEEIITGLERRQIY